MSVLVLVIAGMAALSLYGYGVLPRPFFQIVPDRGNSVVRVALASRVLAALRQGRPCLELNGAELAALRRCCPEPLRPFISWRGSMGYYDAAASEGMAPGVHFPSRLALLLLPVRVPFDHVLSLVFNVLTLLAYGLVLVWAFVRLRISAWCHRADLAALPSGKAEMLLGHLDDHLNRFVSPAYLGEILIMGEPGYFMFKLAEGRLFRAALAQLGVRHPNCDVGPDSGVISALHLKAVDRIDAALDTRSYTMSSTAKSYGEFRYGFIEDMPFGERRFADLYMIHVVDHIPDLDKAMAAVARMLEPGGRVYMSGLSHDFSGWWLERLCAAGCVWNNQPLEWYRDLCRRHGLEPVWDSYCQAFPASLVWKVTYGFAMKTRAWTLLGRWLGAGPGRRRFVKAVLRALWRDAFLLDEILVRRQGKGLNFLMVAEKKDEARR